MAIIISSLSKEYQEPKRAQVLSKITAVIPQGRMTVLFGKNGSGKTTLLNCIAGIIPFEKGKIVVDVNNVKYTLNGDREERISVNIRKNIGYVFQQKALWQHLTALQNITHPLIKVHGLDKEEAEARAIEYLDLLAFEESDYKKHPNQLSGGQQRKIAIARTFAIKPSLLLIDELEANLDKSALDSTLDIIKADFIDEKKTVILISHSIDLLEQFAPEILLLHKKRIAVIADGLEELLKKKASSKKTSKIIEDSLDPSSSRWFFAQQCTEATIKISRLNLELKDVNKLLTEIGRVVSELITILGHGNQHLLLIAIKSTTEAPIKIVSAEKTSEFILDGNEVPTLGGILSTPVAEDGRSRYSFIETKDKYLIGKSGEILGKKAEETNAGGYRHDSLMDMMFNKSAKLSYRSTVNHPKIKHVYHIGKPIKKESTLEQRSYYEFSKGTENIYLIGCVDKGKTKAVISIDTYSKRKWSNFTIRQLVLIGNMIAIAIRNHDTVKGELQYKDF